MKPRMLAAVLLTSVICQGQSNLADQVIDRAIAAMGGLDRIRAIHSLVLRGTHYEGSYPQEGLLNRTANAFMVRMRPNMRLIGCRPEIPSCAGQWSRIVESYDGERGWELNWPKQRLVHTVNKAEQALRCGAEFDFLFIDYKQRGFQATYLGIKSVLGTRTVAVQIDQQGCSSGIYFFDPESYQHLMTQITVPVHARGDAVPTIAVYKAYKIVNGVRLPSRTEEYNLDTGEVMGGSDIISIDANTLTDPAIFRAPAVHPTGITAVVLDMLEAANSHTPQEMLTLYTQYRNTSEGHGADVRYDMNWLGFELLKVDKYDHAFAVFQQMVAENPASADAYESIGDAYLQQGDTPKAVDAFQRALDLGLKSDDVQRKLARLRRDSPNNPHRPEAP